VASTGFEAVVKASYHLPDAVVIGDWLEGLDGSEAARLIAMCPATAQIPVITRPDDGTLLERLQLVRLRRVRGS
jgi:CheY-like chemotaxis protein